MSQSDKEKASKILTSPNAVEFMSSEESEVEGTPSSCRGVVKNRKTKKLQWERTKLKNIKITLDRMYESSLTPAQQRASAKVRRSEEFSDRKVPTQSPGWAVREY